MDRAKKAETKPASAVASKQKVDIALLDAVAAQMPPHNASAVKIVREMRDARY